MVQNIAFLGKSSLYFGKVCVSYCHWVDCSINVNWVKLVGSLFTISKFSISLEIFCPFILLLNRGIEISD